MRVLGIDPGFGRMGYGIVERKQGMLCAVGYGLFESEKSKPLASRLLEIHGKVRDLIEHYSPDCVATEALLFAQNRTTALDVSKALGAILVAAAESGLPWEEYSPPQVKSTVTGNGSADKKQVQFMVSRLLNLKEQPKPDDVADALAVAICHLMNARVRAL